MAFIDKKNPVVINIKLTSKGRELLSKGKLNFTYYAIGDSEIDYNFVSKIENDPNVTDYSAFNSMILRPVDKNPNIISFIPKSLSGDPYNYINIVPTSYYTVHNKVDSVGFFSNSGETFITDSNHIKQPDVMIQVNTVNGGQSLTLKKAPTYGTSTLEPTVGDLLFVRWTYTNSTTGYSVNNTFPTPNLFYKITGIVSGSLSTNDLNVVVDRELPNFSNLTIPSNIHAGAMVLYDLINYTGSTLLNMSSTDYVDESVLSFLENSQSPTIIYPFWNLSIIYTEEIAGVGANNLKYTQFKNKAMGGFVSYIQNQAPIYKKLGVIHYTNNSPANVYAEGFLLKTPTIRIPTIMWHKSNSDTLGVTLIASGDSKLLTGTTKSLDVVYYDLCDINGFVVGKVFPDLKIFVIEDQELLFAMSYKSNRSWTLPNYIISSI